MAEQVATATAAPEVNTNPSGSAISGQVSGGQSQTPAATGTGSDPWAAKGWKSIDDAWKGYSELEKKLGEQGNELGQYKNAYGQTARQAQEFEKALQAWDQWYKSDLQPHWEDVQKFLKTRQGQQVAAQAAQAMGSQVNPQSWSEGWDQLSPQQQAERMQQVSVQQIAGALTPAIQNWQKQFVEQQQRVLAEKEAYFNNYLSLYRKVMDMRLADPSLDVDSVLDQAVRVLGGQIDPIELGKQLATATSSREAYAKQLVDQARKDWETEQQNKELAAVKPNAGGTPPAFKVKSAGTGKGDLSRMREDVARQLMETHGAGVFSPGGLK